MKKFNKILAFVCYRFILYINLICINVEKNFCQSGYHKNCHIFTFHDELQDTSDIDDVH